MTRELNHEGVGVETETLLKLMALKRLCLKICAKVNLEGQLPTFVKEGPTFVQKCVAKEL